MTAQTDNIVGPLLLNAEVFMPHVNNPPSHGVATPHSRHLLTIGTDYQRSVPVRLQQYSGRLKYAEDGDGMPTFSCPVLVLVCLYIVSEARPTRN